MLRVRSRELELLMQLVDVALMAGVFLALLVSTAGRALADADLASLSRLLPLGLVASLAWPLALWVVDLYDSQRRETLRHTLGQLVRAGVLVVLAGGTTAFATSAPVHPVFPLICGSVQFAVLAVQRSALYAALHSLRRRGRNTRNILIAGSGPRADYVERVIQRHPEWGIVVIGFIDDAGPPSGPVVDRGRIFDLRHIRELLKDQVIDEVIVACPRSRLESIVCVVDAAAEAGVPITLLSDLFGDYLPAPQVQRFGSLPALRFAPVHHNAASLAVKRLIDVVGATVGLILTAPILAAAAVAIKLTSQGPVLFRQVRCTLHGRHFVMPKLRTMYVDAEARRTALEAHNEMDGPVFKMRDDPRVTPVGRILRRYSLDELPQLASVLMGHMSLVGPRPPVPTEVASYETFERRRLSMRPGLTCLWQVSGRNEIGFDDWVRMDLQYIDTWSLATDLRILLRTLPAVASGRGAS